MKFSLFIQKSQISMNPWKINNFHDLIHSLIQLLTKARINKGIIVRADINHLSYHQKLTRKSKTRMKYQVFLKTKGTLFKISQFT